MASQNLLRVIMERGKSRGCKLSTTLTGASGDATGVGAWEAQLLWLLLFSALTAPLP